jgi:hypothetical protein
MYENELVSMFISCNVIIVVKLSRIIMLLGIV